MNMTSSKQPKEESLPIYDQCLADALVKTGISVGIGSALSVLLFKRKYWPVVFGAGLGIGVAYSNCQHKFSKQDQVQAYRVRATDTATLKALKLRSNNEAPDVVQPQGEAASNHFSPLLADPPVTSATYVVNQVSHEEQVRYDPPPAAEGVYDYQAYQTAYNNYYQQSQAFQPAQYQDQPQQAYTPQTTHQQPANSTMYQQQQNYAHQLQQQQLQQQQVAVDAAALQQQHDYYNPQHHGQHHYGYNGQQ